MPKRGTREERLEDVGTNEGSLSWSETQGDESGKGRCPPEWWVRIRVLYRNRGRFLKEFKHFSFPFYTTLFL